MMVTDLTLLNIGLKSMFLSQPALPYSQFCFKSYGTDYSSNDTVKNAFNRNFYVDDLLLSLDCEDETVELMNSIKI